MRGVSHSTVPPCFGEADRMGCLWREAVINVVKNKGGRSGIKTSMQLWGAYSWTRGME